MSAWYMLMDPRFALYTSPFAVGRTGGRALGNLAGRPARNRNRVGVIESIRRSFARRAAMQELSRLDDRMLADIGIARNEITAVVDRVDVCRGKTAELYEGRLAA